MVEQDVPIEMKFIMYFGKCDIVKAFKLTCLLEHQPHFAIFVVEILVRSFYTMDGT